MGKIFVANRVALDAAVIVGMIDEFSLIARSFHRLPAIRGILIPRNSR